MKIKEVHERTVHIVETDDESYPTHTRHSPNSWTVQMGESGEQVYDCAELEAAFQSFTAATASTMKPTDKQIHWRFRSKTIPLTEAEARKSRDEEILNALSGIEGMVQALRELMKSDLPTTKSVMVEVKPGEEGYEEAMYEMGVISGGFSFKKEEKPTE